VEYARSLVCVGAPDSSQAKAHCLALGEPAIAKTALCPRFSMIDHKSGRSSRAHSVLAAVGFFLSLHFAAKPACTRLLAPSIRFGLWGQPVEETEKSPENPTIFACHH